MADIQAQSTGGQLAVEIQAPRIGTTVDFATLLGVGGAFVMIAGAMMLSGQAAAFLDVPSILIVVGGTFLVTTIPFSLRELAAPQGPMLRAPAYPPATPHTAA